MFVLKNNFFQFFETRVCRTKCPSSLNVVTKIFQVSGCGSTFSMLSDSSALVLSQISKAVSCISLIPVITFKKYIYIHKIVKINYSPRHGIPFFIYPLKEIYHFLHLSE